MSVAADPFECIINDGDLAELDESYPFYPLLSPGMPLPGENFIKEAERLGGEDAVVVEGKGRQARPVSVSKWLHHLYRKALYSTSFHRLMTVKGVQRILEYVPGHKKGFVGAGPTQCDVMVIGKHPGQEEVQEKTNFAGPRSVDFDRALGNLNIPTDETDHWYITNLCKFDTDFADPTTSTMPAKWIKDDIVLLQQELRMVLPKYIMCFGSDAAKALLGKSATVGKTIGQVIEYKFPISVQGEELEYHTTKVMVNLHPAAVYIQPEKYGEFESRMQSFYLLTQGADPGRDNTEIEYVFKRRHLEKVVEKIQHSGETALSIDCEWHGDGPGEPGAYLRTIQISHRPDYAAVIVLRRQGGVPAFKPGMASAIEPLIELCKNSGMRVGGHFFRSDLPWLKAYGIDLCKEYEPPADDPPDTPGGRFGWEKCRTEGGFDTGLMAHAFDETGDYKLESQACRFTGANRYDLKLQQWKERECKRLGIKAEQLEGYGECPDEILLPYSGHDAAKTAGLERFYAKPNGALDSDLHDNPSWFPYWMSHRASGAYLEMETMGLLLDRDRAEELTDEFMLASSRLQDDLRELIRWPDFNANSHFQCRELMFGERYNKKENKENPGEAIRLRPEGAVSLNLLPVKSTGQKSRMWDRVTRAREEHLYTASTDKEVLGILGQTHPVAMQLRDLKFINQVLRMVLRRPQQSKDGVTLRDAEGNRVYEKGLIASIRADGRVHTSLYQTKETGRSSSARPPLQNISKRREGDYKRILGDLHQHPIRSILRATPGCVFIEADYTGAELAGIAWMSQCPPMIEHVRRNLLPEDHPDFYDIHSNSAVKAFGLTCEPTKQGLKSIGMGHLRIGAKTVNFGIPYGRGAPAIARTANEEGANIVPDDAQRMIDAYYAMYPETDGFLSACRERVVTPGWMVSCFGRFRRFPPTDDEKVLGDLQRQAQNFPIQSMVADAMNCALDNLWEYRRHHSETPFRIMLQIHDAILLEVPIPHIDTVVDHVLPLCMEEMVDVWPSYLDGSPILEVTEPYKFGIGIDVEVHWGEKISAAEGQALGIPGKYCAAA